MKNKILLDHVKTSAVTPSGSFFCPEPRLENGSFDMYWEWFGVTPWNSSDTENDVIGP